MKRGLLSVLAFLAGAIAGLALCFFAYLALTTFGGVFDFEGSMAMGFAFTIGPIVALICGIVAAVWTARRVS
jgi:hypothetical protein